MSVNLVDLIDPPELVATLPATPEGREALVMFAEIDRAHPDFFAFVARMAGMGMPTKEDGGSDRDCIVNEGKRVLAIELMAILQVAETWNLEESKDEN